MAAAAVAAASLIGCAGGSKDENLDNNTVAPPAVNPGSFQGVDEAEANLTPLTNPCSFSADGGSMTINLSAGEFTLVGKATSGAIEVNGTQCGTATDSNTKKITINGSPDGGNETVILDYLNGAFAAGTSAAPGVVIDLKAGTTDTVKIRGSEGADTIYLGTGTAGAGSLSTYAVNVGIGAAPDANRDVTFTGVEAVTIATGPGADVVTGAAHASTGNTNFGKVASGTTLGFTVFAGADADTLTGGDGADTLNGEDGADVLNGSLGADTESGGAGDDVLNQGAVTNGGDTLSGGADNDTLNYGSRTANLTVTVGVGANDGEASENDNVDGTFETFTLGSANDTITCGAATACIVNAGAGNDTITGSSAADTITAGDGDDVVTPGAATDTVTGGNGNDTISYADRAVSVTVVLGAAGAATTTNGIASENDSIAGFENAIGGSNDDTITGNELDNKITGGDGDDTLTGGAGNDTFLEGAASNGGDVFNGGTGEDVVDYSARIAALTVTMDGVAANDGEASETDDVKADVENIVGGSAGDTITGNDGDNKIDGAGGDDTLTGGLGADQITGGAGNDTMDSGDGNDIIDPGTGTADTATCGAGLDTLIRTAGVTNTSGDCEL